MATMGKQTTTPPLAATIGFAADEQGHGVAYVRLTLAHPEGNSRGRLLRIPFPVKRCPALLEREIGYAALTAVAARLHERGVDRVRLSLEDGRVVEDLRERRSVPQALSMAYVRLGCALNQLREVAIEVDAGNGARDLTARAKAEAALHVAA
ncbi:MAG: hypothetical protein ACYDEU_01015 [Vulcanimicrobiaceae bacterium]